MSESALFKMKWIVVGTVIGTVVSLSVEYWIKPLLASTPNVDVSASRDKHGSATFTITNTGKAVATDVAVTLWATGLRVDRLGFHDGVAMDFGGTLWAPVRFVARTDITRVEHAGGITDSPCDVGIYQARLMVSGSMASALNTESQAVLIQCKRINSQEQWRGHLEYQGPEEVFGLLVHVKHAGASENKYARFADGIGQ